MSIIFFAMVLTFWVVHPVFSFERTPHRNQQTEKKETTLKGFVIVREQVEADLPEDKELADVVEKHDEWRVTISKEGKELFSVKERQAAWAPFAGELDGNDVPVLLDLKGDQDFSYIILMTHSGGAHCCNTYYIFKLGEKLEYQAIQNHPNEGVKFISQKDVPYRAEASDETFLYFKNFCYANSARPSLMFIFRDECFVLDREAMKRDISEDNYRKMSKDNFDKIDECVKKNDCAELDRVLLDQILGLVYSGNAKRAWYAFDQLAKKYPLFLSGNSAEKQVKNWAEAKEELINQLKKSPYYTDILAINDGVIG